MDFSESPPLESPFDEVQRLWHEFVTRVDRLVRVDMFGEHITLKLKANKRE